MGILLNCVYCGIEFERAKNRHNQALKLGRRSYCSKKCLGKDNFDKNVPLEKRRHLDNLRPRSKTLDCYSSFRYDLTKIKSRCKTITFLPCELTLDILKRQWELQDGKCPYSGWNLVQRQHQNDKLSLTPDRASIDRIDSSKGYTNDNIQFVSIMAQFAKNMFLESELILFCQDVVCNKDSELKRKNRIHIPNNPCIESVCDSLLPFQWHLKNIRKRIKAKTNDVPILDITLEDLKHRWELQDGICPYSGWLLKQMNRSWDQLPITPDRASIDRIDSSKGYTNDNIQFVSIMAQYGKNKFHENELIRFCRDVVKCLASKKDVASALLSSKSMQ